MSPFDHSPASLSNEEGKLLQGEHDAFAARRCTFSTFSLGLSALCGCALRLAPRPVAPPPRGAPPAGRSTSPLWGGVLCLHFAIAGNARNVDHAIAARGPHAAQHEAAAAEADEPVDRRRPQGASLLRRCSGGLMDSLRKMSLDDSLRKTSWTSVDPASEQDDLEVSDYQEAFHEMKREHPTASVGALHQMAVASITELKPGPNRQSLLDLSERTGASPLARGSDVSGATARRWRSNSDLHLSRRAKKDSALNASHRSNDEWSMPGVGDRDAKLAPRRKKSLEGHRPFCSDGELEAQSVASDVSGLSLMSDMSKWLQDDGDASAEADEQQLEDSGAKHLRRIRVRTKNASSSPGHTCSDASAGSLGDASGESKSCAPDDDASNGSSACGFGDHGLILGFSARCESKEEEDDDDGLIVGFVDRRSKR